MKMVLVLAAAVLWVGLAQAVWAETPEKELTALEPRTALEEKLIGAWQGRIGCDGHFVFRPDGTYDLTGYGPGAEECAGTWQVRGDALPAILALTCKTADFPEAVGNTKELKLIKLDDQSLAVEYANPNGSPSGQYTRVKR